MLLLITYDVSTISAEGRTRLRKVAKECINYGQRVQNSVFEVNTDYGTVLKIKDRLEKIIDKKEDSLRFYFLGNNWEKRIEHIGIKDTINMEDTIIL